MSFNIPQIVSVTSESLQAKIRSLLPSQQGFGADLQASNVIFPVVDLTSAAEGSGVPESMQQALAFGSQTSFSANGSTAVIANSPGFYRIYGVAVAENDTSSVVSATLSMSDGLTAKEIWKLSLDPTTQKYAASENIDIICFLASGESISAISTDATKCHFNGSSRQVADVNGNLVNPVGFTPQ